MKPIVYLRENQVNTLFHEFSGQKKISDGTAYSWDDNTVFHAYTNSPRIHPAGLLTKCRIVLLPESDFGSDNASQIDSFLHGFQESRSALIIILAFDEDRVRHKCYVVNGREKVEGEVKFIPERSDLYSRSKGLLETDILAEKEVGIVGLGSGGSPIAIELAKAGVGRFVLIDFDRLELANLARHVCGINDLGRFKTLAVRDAIQQKNPHAEVTTLEVDVNKQRDECLRALSNVSLLICASDNDRSRFFLNEIALKHKTTTIFGRALTRAVGGDILRVRPFKGPCYSCLYSQNIRQQGSDDEEISQESQARALSPDYSSEQDIKAVVQVGLSSDIAPISNLMVKIALVELSRGLNSGIQSLEEDFVADLYLWANRRENIYEGWTKLEFNFTKPTILRWYGAKVPRDPNCMVCGS